MNAGSPLQEYCEGCPDLTKGGMIGVLAKFEAGLTRAVWFLCVGLAGLMVIVIFAQVIFRYVFQNSLSWSEELGRYLFVWITFLGAALGIREKAHVALDAFINVLPPAVRKPVFWIGYLAMIALALAMVVTGKSLIELGMRQRTAAMQIPMGYVYVVLPTSGALIIFYLILDLLGLKKEGQGA